MSFSIRTTGATTWSNLAQLRPSKCPSKNTYHVRHRLEVRQMTPVWSSHSRMVLNVIIYQMTRKRLKDEQQRYCCTSARLSTCTTASCHHFQTATGMGSYPSRTCHWSRDHISQAGERTAYHQRG